MRKQMMSTDQIVFNFVLYNSCYWLLAPNETRTIAFVIIVVTVVALLFGTCLSVTGNWCIPNGIHCSNSGI